MISDNNTTMSDEVFSRFSSFIHSELGIKMPETKKTMLQARLQKRMRRLGLQCFDAYYEHIFNGDQEEELSNMVDAITTNKTDFFREPTQFEYLKHSALPELAQRYSKKIRKNISVWSAGCSTGEEPYTLAMVLANFFQQKSVGNFSILASDISTQVLATAKRGLYPENAVKPVPTELRHKYLMRGKGSQNGFCRIVPELRERIIFKHLNLNTGKTFGIRTPMDILFCRNVIIYFDRQTQIKLFNKFYSQLASGGYMFIGHAESLLGINDRFRSVGPSIYQKP